MGTYSVPTFFYFKYFWHCSEGVPFLDGNEDHTLSEEDCNAIKFQIK